MSTRFIFAVVSSLVEWAVLLVILLWVLPHLGIKMPVAVTVALVVVLGIYNVVAYRIGSRALKRRPVVGLPDMVGTEGKAVGPLAPEGMVRIRGELWEAVSSDTRIEAGEEVVVVAQDGLKLTVRRSGNARG